MFNEELLGAYSALDAKMSSIVLDTCGTSTGRVYCGPKVPVRRGGPWHGSGKNWEDWHDGVYHMSNPRCRPYRVRKGVLEYRNGHYVWCKAQMVDGLNGVELRAPKGYGGPVPEGCAWVEDDQLKPGDRVKLLGDACIAETLGECCLKCVGKFGTVRVRADEDDEVEVEVDEDLCHSGPCSWSARLCERLPKIDLVPIRLGGPWMDKSCASCRHDGEEDGYSMCVHCVSDEEGDGTHWKPKKRKVKKAKKRAISCRTCGVSNGETVCPADGDCEEFSEWQPKDEAKFSVGDRVRQDGYSHIGTVVTAAALGCNVRWDIAGNKSNHPFADTRGLGILPASEDPLPRKAGVVVYEVTKEEYDNVCTHRAGDSTFSASRIDGCCWSTGSSPEYFLKSAVAGETWIIYRE